MPLITRRNKKEFNIFNNERFICEMIKKNKIIIKTDKDEKIDIKLEEIYILFYLRFTIYEWEKMNTKLRYVALSRSTDKNILI
jgi:hypothetical protein